MVRDGIPLWLPGSSRSGDMLNDAQQQFPRLVGYLVCLGMPVGIILGIRGSLRFRESEPQFHWGRAIVAGGVARTIRVFSVSAHGYTGACLSLLRRPPPLQSQGT